MLNHPGSVNQNQFYWNIQILNALSWDSIWTTLNNLHDICYTCFKFDLILYLLTFRAPWVPVAPLDLQVHLYVFYLILQSLVDLLESMHQINQQFFIDSHAFNENQVVYHACIIWSITVFFPGPSGIHWTPRRAWRARFSCEFLQRPFSFQM